MSTVGLRELRQEASELVRRVQEAGETITITVSGRPAAQLVPAPRRTWRRDADVRAIFAGLDDPRWDSDRDALDTGLRDPWTAA